MPAMGLGTGGYGYRDDLHYPECWLDNFPGRACGCAHRVTDAVAKWARLGGRRIDTANSYYNLFAVADGIKRAKREGVDPEDLFITAKVGPSFSLGYNDTLVQVHDYLEILGVQRLDTVLIHWPDQREARYTSSDPLCRGDDATSAEERAALPPLPHLSASAARRRRGWGGYNATACRLSTWRALVDMWRAGKARSIGVANFNTAMLEEIRVAGLPLPAMNQCPFNPYRNLASLRSVPDWLAGNGVLLAGYSPLGIPDLAVPTSTKNDSMVMHGFPAPMTKTLIGDPVVRSIARRHNRSAAQVVLNWQWASGVPVNPRSDDEAHMRENLDAFDFRLSTAEMGQLGALPQDWCEKDDWYECAGSDGHPAPLVGCSDY